ncbi:hypothetical protein V2J09_020863 [Rumex salicifolius]
MEKLLTMVRVSVFILHLSWLMFQTQWTYLSSCAYITYICVSLCRSVFPYPNVSSPSPLSPITSSCHVPLSSLQEATSMPPSIGECLAGADAQTTILPSQPSTSVSSSSTMETETSSGSTAIPIPVLATPTLVTLNRTLSSTITTSVSSTIPKCTHLVPTTR